MNKLLLATALTTSIGISQWCTTITNLDNIDRLIIDTSKSTEELVECNKNTSEIINNANKQWEIDNFVACFQENFVKKSNDDVNTEYHTLQELKRIAAIYSPDLYTQIKDITKYYRLSKISKYLFQYGYFMSWLNTDIEGKILKITVVDTSNNPGLKKIFSPSAIQTAQAGVYKWKYNTGSVLGHHILGVWIIYEKQIQKHWKKRNELIKNNPVWDSYTFEDFQTSVLQNETAHSIIKNFYQLPSIMKKFPFPLSKDFDNYGSYDITFVHIHEFASDAASLVDNLSFLPNFIKNLLFSLKIDKNWELNAKPNENPWYMLTQNILLQELIKINGMKDILEKQAKYLHMLEIKNMPDDELENKKQVSATKYTREILSLLTLQDWENIWNKYLELFRSVFK